MGNHVLERVCFVRGIYFLTNKIDDHLEKGAEHMPIDCDEGAMTGSARARWWYQQI